MGLKLSRRTILRGLGGFAVALPALEIMGPSRASADTGAPPKRFMVSFGGVSTGADSHAVDMMAPDIVGKGYDLKRALLDIGELGVQDDISIVSGLKLPWGTGSDIPPGGRSVFYHYNTVGPQLSGMNTGPERDGVPKGPTADQVVAGAIGEGKRVLTYRIQVASYINYNGSDNNTGGTSMTLSWKKDSDGNLVPEEPTFSPKNAYESLFSTFEPTDPEEAKKAKALLERRKSILDLVDWSTARLIPKLGAADKQRMERHFDEIRALEERIAALPPVGGACKLPDHPGEDPPLGGASSIYQEDGSVVFDETAGYSNEDLRGDVLTDLICMAFACDLSRVASLLMTEWKCYMNMNQIAGWPLDVHGLTHDANLEGVSDAVGWHVKQLARLTKKLRDTPEVDGSSLLDHSALVLLFEGGHGYDPEGDSYESSHSTENMCALIAGRAGGLNPGQHVVATDKHPAQVVISAMDAVGATGGLGELSEGIPELFA